MSEGTLSLSAEQLQTLISAAVESAVKAAKAPSEFEQRKLDADMKRIEQEQQERLALSESIQETARQKHAYQLVCSHKHPAFDGGRSHCVWIQELRGPGYLLCQACQGKIRPGVTPENYKGYEIFDTRLFNVIMQDVQVGGELFA